MEGIVSNYRIKYTKEAIVIVPGIKTRNEARNLVGKCAVWVDEKGNEWKGKVVAPHGNSGAVRVRFSKPLPPKALGKIIKIETEKEAISL